jgi:hypothetical protein
MLVVSLISICFLLLIVGGVALRWRQRRMVLAHSRSVCIIAASPGTMRDLAASAPRRDSEQRARSDRHFGYASVRRPRYRDELDLEMAEVLRPTQVVRVRDAAERVRLEASIPEELNVVFVELSAPEPGGTVPLPRIISKQ